MSERPTRTSYSALSTWKDCAAAYKFSYLDGLSDPAGEAAARGSRLHLAAERFLKGKLSEDKLPVDFWRVKDEMILLKGYRAKSEQTWCINRDWKVCDELDEDVWFKAVVDVHYRQARSELVVIDLKTGKIYDDHVEQLQLYATIGLRRYPKVKTVHVSGLYIDQGRYHHQATYPRTMEKHLIKYWDDMAKALMADEEFKPNPSESNCRYCNFSYRRGGPCESAP